MVTGSLGMFQVSAQRRHLDQPDLADLDAFELPGAQQPPQVLDVITRYLGSHLDGCMFLDN